MTRKTLSSKKNFSKVWSRSEINAILKEFYYMYLFYITFRTIKSLKWKTNSWLPGVKREKRQMRTGCGHDRVT